MSFQDIKTDVNLLWDDRIPLVNIGVDHNNTVNFEIEKEKKYWGR